MGKAKLPADEWRALGILANRDAHELQSDPLFVLSALVRRGLATREPYTSQRKRGGKVDACWRVSITEKGRAALQEPSNG